MNIKLIAAVSRNGLIGDAKNNNIPWMGKYPSDMKFFREMTKNSEVIMGRRTFESLGNKPLPKRNNVVITKQEKMEGVSCFPCLRSFVDSQTNILDDTFPNKWIIGGERLYREALLLPETKEIFLTLIPEVVETDNPVRFPWIDPQEFKILDYILLEQNLKIVHYVRAVR